MREYNQFKFRAWDGEQMHYNITPWQWDFAISLGWHRCDKSTGDGLLGSGGKTGEFLVPGVRFENLMQFTGIKDAGGVDIYEGDIVDIKFGNDWMSGDKYSFGQSPIFFDDKEHGWCVSNHTGHVTRLSGFYLPELKVIGNIYEQSTNEHGNQAGNTLEKVNKP